MSKQKCPLTLGHWQYSATDGQGSLLMTENALNVDFMLEFPSFGRIPETETYCVVRKF